MTRAGGALFSLDGTFPSGENNLPCLFVFSPDGTLFFLGGTLFPLGGLWFSPDGTLFPPDGVVVPEEYSEKFLF